VRLARRASGYDVDAAACLDRSDDAGHTVKVTRVGQCAWEIVLEGLEAHAVEVDAHADLDARELQAEAGPAAAAAQVAGSVLGCGYSPERGW